MPELRLHPDRRPPGRTTRPTQPGGGYRGPVGGAHSYAGHSGSRVVVRDHRGGNYGHGAYGGHRFY